MLYFYFCLFWFFGWFSFSTLVFWILIRILYICRFVYKFCIISHISPFLSVIDELSSWEHMSAIYIMHIFCFWKTWNLTFQMFSITVKFLNTWNANSLWIICAAFLDFYTFYLKLAFCNAMPLPLNWKHQKAGWYPYIKSF